MNIPLQLIILSIPSLVLIAVRKLQKKDWNSTLDLVGWKLSNWKHMALGLGLGLLPGLFSPLLPEILPGDVMDQPGIAQSAYQGWKLTLPSFLLAFLREAFYTALGEEIFFRGFFGNFLIRKVGFAVGNILQAAVFLLPHLLLLTVSLKLWPVLIAQFIAGWLFGWLLYKSGSILPGWLAHSLSNAFGALVFMG